MKLYKLRNLDVQMRRRGEEYTGFEFVRNNVTFDVYFCINTQPCYRLGFLVHRANFELWIDVMRGYIINVKVSYADYQKLCQVLGFKKGDGHVFHPSNFFSDFHESIPSELPPQNPVKLRRDLAKVYPNVDRTDGTYYKGRIDWDKPENKGKGNRRPENLEKTKLLYPELYKFIKDKNISVKYTVHAVEENAAALIS